LEGQISKLALTAGWRIGINGLGNTMLGSGSRILTNIATGQDWRQGAVMAGATSGVFALGGSGLQEGVIGLNRYLAGRAFDELLLSDKFLLMSNAVHWSTESSAFEKVVNAVGLGFSSMSPLHEECSK